MSSLVVINKADLNSQAVGTLEEMCDTEGVDVVGRVPYDPIVTEAELLGDEHGADSVLDQIAAEPTADI